MGCVAGLSMNSYGWIILIALLADYLIGIVSDLLNIRAMKSQIPSEFEGVYDAESYARSQAYTKERTRFGLLSGTFSIILLLIFWFAGGFQWVDEIVRGFGYGPVLTGVSYIALIMVAQTLISLPFGIYSTFVIEEKYGFNKTTPGLFVSDMAKSLALGVAIGGPLLATVLWFFESFGAQAWLWIWGILTLFTLGLQYIAPTWIMPLFNKFEPLEDETLKERLLRYAERVNFGLKDIFMMDGSKRSTKSNAFFTGFGKNKRIALFDTLLENHTQDEIMAVVAHEVGHYKKRHIVKGMILSVLHSGVVLWLLSQFLTVEALFDAFFVENPSVYTGLIFFGMLYQPVEMVLGVLLNMQSRKHEFEADAFAVETAMSGDDEDSSVVANSKTGEVSHIARAADAMTNALKKLSLHNLSNLTPHPFYAFMNYSHPPVLERIKAIKERSSSTSGQ